MKTEADVESQNPRRRNMQANRRRDTSPELALRSALHSRGHRYRCDLLLRFGDQRVRPDLVFTRKRVAVFVDGCFWHACPLHGRQPRTNSDYWVQKLERNRLRDSRDLLALADNGWLAVRIWEHVPLVEAVEAVETALETPRSR